MTGLTDHCSPTCVFCGGVGQVDSMATVMGPTHELDSNLVAG